MKEELEKLLTSLPQYNLGDDPITDEPFTAEETIAIYPELNEAVTSIINLVDKDMAKFGLKRGVEYNVKKSDTVIVITLANQRAKLKRDK